MPREIGAVCLAEPFGAAVVDDHRVPHVVTPFVPVDAGQLACRDVLVATFKAT